MSDASGFARAIDAAMDGAATTIGANQQQDDQDVADRTARRLVRDSSDLDLVTLARQYLRFRRIPER